MLPENLKPYRGWIIAAAIFVLLLIGVVIFMAVKIYKTPQVDPLNTYLREQVDSLTRANIRSQAVIETLKKQEQKYEEELSDINRELDRTKQSQREKIITVWLDASVPRLERYFTERYPDSLVTSYQSGSYNR